MWEWGHGVLPIRKGQKVMPWEGPGCGLFFRGSFSPESPVLQVQRIEDPVGSSKELDRDLHPRQVQSTVVVVLFHCCDVLGVYL